jgi:DNA (cytosine-5)-methyltransferase 3A
MNVLSLCDGMSCGQIALIELGAKYDKYYASEIDKHAIKQTQLNFPDTIQLGDIEGWKGWDVDWGSIGLILAGTPCTGFSLAGKQLAFNDPQSRLFFVFVEILNHVKKHNPDVLFLLENVKMKKKYIRIISEMVGVFPVLINSALVSAQNRERYYWSNMKSKPIGLFGEVHTDIPRPNDKGILLRDILEEEVDEKYYVSKSAINRVLRKGYSKPAINPEKTGTLNTKNNSGQMSIDSGTTFISINGKAPTQRKSTGRCLDLKHNYQFIKINKDGDVKSNQEKASCLAVGGNGAGDHSDMDLILQLGRGFNKGGIREKKAPTLSANSWEQNNLVIQLNPSKESNGTQPRQQSRVYSPDGEHPALLAELGGRNNTFIKDRIRRLTPIECARLQTVPAWYKWKCSDTQVYRMCGNGWTVEVIKHILSFLPPRFFPNMQLKGESRR